MLKIEEFIGKNINNYSIMMSSKLVLMMYYNTPTTFPYYNNIEIHLDTGNIKCNEYIKERLPYVCCHSEQMSPEFQEFIKLKTI